MDSTTSREWTQRELERAAELDQLAVTFDAVLERELHSVREARRALDDSGTAAEEHDGSSTDGSKTVGETPIEKAHAARLLGLAFSGGGIRSAVFNLGVLQSLARLHLLQKIDYLSSVSGGGYIASWLHAWIHRRSRDCAKDEGKTRGLIAVEEELRRSADCTELRREEAPEIRRLRQYSNYLTPHVGVFSADAITAVMSTLRNFFLNFVIATALLLLVFSIPWLVLHGLSVLAPHALSRIANDPRVAADAGAAAVLASRVQIGLLSLGLLTTAGGMALGARLSRLARPAMHGESTDAQALSRSLVRQSRGCAYLLVAGPVLLGIGIVIPVRQGLLALDGWRFVLACAALYACPFAFGWWQASVMRTEVETTRRCLQQHFSMVSGAAVFAGLVHWIARYAAPPPSGGALAAYSVWAPTFVPALVAIALALSLIVQVGIAGRSYGEYTREWWSRTSGVALRCSLLVVAAFAMALYGPYLAELASKTATQYVVAAGFGWVVTSAVGIFGARRGLTHSIWPFVIRIAPYVFLVGLSLALVWSAFSIARSTLVPGYTSNILLLPWTENVCPVDLPDPVALIVSQLPPSGFESFHDYASLVAALVAPASTWPILSSVAVLLGVAWGLGWFIDINVFSQHMFYRNRLERCFLSRPPPDEKHEYWIDLEPNGSPNLATLTLAERGDPTIQRPYPLLNAAINLTRTKNLAWQERRAASFVLSPGHCGYETDRVTARYQPTHFYVDKVDPAHLSLSTAMTISAAAVSPNAGSFTIGAMSALMTLFNLRLGWWFQNTNHLDHWRTAGPHFAPWYLIKEFLSMADEESTFVHLSDGGHFDNLGLYELVRRRCKYVILCDAGHDPECSFSDLGNAIRKCRADFGIDIEIDPRPIALDPKTGFSSVHCVMGSIRYDRAEGTDRRKWVGPGRLLYVKASLTGDEPADVLAFKAKNTSFPHESTRDQFFKESQFESYRALGEHVMSEVMQTARSAERASRRRCGRRAEDLRIARALAAAGSACSEPGTTSEAFMVSSDDPSVCDCEALFVHLTEKWQPVGRFQQRASDFSRQWLALQQRARKDPSLAFLESQIFPEWGALEDGIPDRSARGHATMLPSSHDELRSAFHFCCALIDLMELAYGELRLEDSFERSDNRGVMNLFRHWSGSGMFRATWAVAVSTHGPRFQEFCARHFELTLGRISIGAWLPVRNVLERPVERTNPLVFPNFAEWTLLNEMYAVTAASSGVAAWSGLHVAAVVLTVDDPQASRSGTNQGGFSCTVGMALLSRKPGLGTSLHYYRTRDHLRKTGVGRRAIEALWREDCHTRSSLFKRVGQISEDTDLEAFARLCRSVEAAIPGADLRLGSAKLDEYVSRCDERSDRAACLTAAYHAYRRTLQRQPDNEEAVRGIARALRCKYDLACDAAAGADVVRDEHAPEFYLDAAIELLSAWLESAPEAALVHYDLGRYLWHSSTFEPDRKTTAIASLLRAVELRPPLTADLAHDGDLDGIREVLLDCIARQQRIEASQSTSS